MTLKGGARGVFFSGGPTVIKFSMITHVGKGRVSKGVSHVPILRRWDPCVSQNFTTPTYSHTVWHVSDQIRHGTSCGRGVFLEDQSHRCPKGAGPQRLQNFWDPLPTPVGFDLDRQNSTQYHIWGTSVFLESRIRPLSKGSPPPEKNWTSSIRPHGVTNRKQILHADQTRRQENFTRSSRSRLYGLDKLRRTLTRDLFAVAKTFLLT